MGTSNFLYRDALYAASAIVYPNETDCICENKISCAGVHEDGCPAAECFFDMFAYTDMKKNLICELEAIRKRGFPYYIHGYDYGWTNDSHNFNGRIVGIIYTHIEVAHELAPRMVSITVGDDLCLRGGYYAGFNFDRVMSDFADFGTDELEQAKTCLYEHLFKYDGLYLGDAVDSGKLNFLEAEALKRELYDIAVAELEAFIAEADRVYHGLGEKYFESYHAVARASNGETFYEKTNT